MKRYELIEKHERVLQECAMAGISVQDWKNAEIYRFVQKRREQDGLLRAQGQGPVRNLGGHRLEDPPEHGKTRNYHIMIVKKGNKVTRRASLLFFFADE